MILCASQPCYLAWMPFLDRIAQADLFVVLDAVQFEKGSYINRNKIPMDGKDKWLTVPVYASLGTTIADTRICEGPWWKKHEGRVRHAYSKTCEKLRLISWVDHLSSLQDMTRLGNLCLRDLEWWLGQYQIKTPVKLMPLKKRKPGGNELVLDLMADFKADTFLAGPLFKNYVKEDLWASSPYKWQEHTSTLSTKWLP